MDSFEINMRFTVKADNVEAARIIANEIDTAMLCNVDFFDCLEEIEICEIYENDEPEDVEEE